ncbi:hypothetical protein CD178_02538 [Komagataeibacter saccharivorans]|uniref:Uncharacterized protein n=1 Tax=Komagataeibacter saccharivorans TaxID=265959 RepID=A0A347WEJ2_9PROT|nr:hypothetical protein [Komagataeibacter saccharivorans]AXY23285.1 hypothetical protein CD178_02538 [Komagataeibacter saccharivorans]
MTAIFAYAKGNNSAIASDRKRTCREGVILYEDVKKVARWRDSIPFSGAGASGFIDKIRNYLTDDAANKDYPISSTGIKDALDSATRNIKSELRESGKSDDEIYKLVHGTIIAAFPSYLTEDSFIFKYSLRDEKGSKILSTITTAGSDTDAFQIIAIGELSSQSASAAFNLDIWAANCIKTAHLACPKYVSASFDLNYTSVTEEGNFQHIEDGYSAFPISPNARFTISW